MRRAVAASRGWWSAAALALWTSCAPSRPAEPPGLAASRESDAAALVARAQAFARAADYARAAQYLRAALQHGGDPARIVPLLVSVEIRDQGYRAAAQHLGDRLRTHPSDVRARFVLAALMSALDRPKQAVQELLRVLEQAPGHAEATFALAVVYRDQMNDPERADDYFRRYLDLTPHGRHREEALSSRLSSTP